MKLLIVSRIQIELDRIAEVAGFLWQRGWAEANGGNISVNLTHLMDKNVREPVETKRAAELAEPFPELAGDLFYVTGAGKRMRDVAKSPLDFGAIIRVTDDGKSFETISEKAVKPTSELPFHLLYFATKASLRVSTLEKALLMLLVPEVVFDG